MHKRPSQIARSLRAFRNAQRMGLLRGIRIIPGRKPCEAAIAQFGIEYPGNAVPRLPLARCSCDRCECEYMPIGSERFYGLDAIARSPRKPPH
jgi:hypothetical protein